MVVHYFENYFQTISSMEQCSRLCVSSYYLTSIFLMFGVPRIDDDSSAFALFHHGPRRLCWLRIRNILIQDIDTQISEWLSVYPYAKVKERLTVIR